MVNLVSVDGHASRGEGPPAPVLRTQIEQRDADEGA
jgi:hypothetical protein